MPAGYIVNYSFSGGMAHSLNQEKWACGKQITTFFTLSVFFFFIHILSSIGQTYQFIRYAEDEGLSNTLVKSVTVDKNSFIWVASDDGLFRFDGHTFTQIRDELPSKYVKSVYSCNNGDLVASTDLGLVSIKSTAQSWKISTIKQGSVKEVDSLLSFPKTIYEDQHKVVWVSDNHKIYSLSNNIFKSYSPGAKASTNNFQRSFSFIEDGFDNLFSFSEPGYVFRYDRKIDKFVEVLLPQKLSSVQCVAKVDYETMLVATHDGIFVLVTDKLGKVQSMKPLKIKLEASYIIKISNDSFLAGTWANGLFVIKQEGNEFTFSQITDFPGKNINHLWRASDGNIWIGSDNGLFLMRSVLFGAPYNQFSSTYIQNINEFADGRICFTDGEKIIVTDPAQQGKAQIIKTVKPTVLQVLPAANGIWYSDVDAKVWVEDYKGVMIHKFDFKPYGNAVFHLMSDKSGNIWACQDANNSLIRIGADFSIKQYGVNQGISSRPLSTAVDAMGKVFAGCMVDSAFLFSYDAGRDRFVNLSKPLKFERNIDININDLAFTKKSVLWIGSSFGLIRYENGVFNRVNTGEMTADAVKAVAVDMNDNVWFGNSLGLHELYKDELLSFDERAGMSSKSINYRCLHFDSRNRIWAGTVNGLIVSSRLQPPTKTISPIVLSLFINNNHEIAFKPSGTVFNNKTFITLNVGVPDYPVKYLKIEMMLQGRDSVWIPLNKSNEIILANLEPGNYTLLIRAKQYGNYIYSDPLVWKFTVKRVWYFRWWILLLIAIGVFVVFWTGLIWYTNTLKRNNEHLEKAINERTKEIISQNGQIEFQNQSIIHKNDELEKTNHELQAAKAKAEEASAAKSKFLSVMTHELRTPMNAVIGFTQLLIQNNPRPDQLEDLIPLRFSAENLLALINNILDFNKIEAGKISLELIEFNLRNLVEEIISTMSVSATEKNIALFYNYDDRLPLNVIGDPLRLSQIINNLVSNALKFTNSGSVTIDLKLNSQVGKNFLIDFSVIDTGIGIDAESLESIFETFTQASSETSRKFGGTGLGLTITQKLLELYGSRIQVRSEADKGTKFSFSINFEEGANASIEATAGDSAYEFSPFNGQHVLLVEDNKVNKIIAYKFLTSWNLQVEIAENGIIAVEKIKDQSFELILMDLQMPEMDGYDATAAIRQYGVEPYNTVPIIALTASSKADVYENIFLSGMNDFISKPYDPIVLHGKIKKYLG